MYIEENNELSKKVNQEKEKIEKVQLDRGDRSSVTSRSIKSLQLDTIKEWLNQDLSITFLMAAAIFILELLLAIFYDTTTHWDAWTRAQIAETYTRITFIEWLPFVPNSENLPGLVWLPGHSYVLAFLHVLTKIPTLYLGEILSAASTAGISCYLFLILKQDLGLPQKRAVLVSLLPLTSGMWVSHGSQCMTDLFAYFLFLITLFHFSKFILPNRSRHPYLHGLFGTLIATFNNFVRYESWVIVSGIVGLIFLISVLLQIQMLIKKEGWKDVFIQTAIKCVVFIILPASAIIIWLLYNYNQTGDFFYTTTWILAHNADWGTTQLTNNSLPYTVLIFFTRLNEATPFWWLIPLSLLVFVLKPNEEDPMDKTHKIWFFFIWATTIFFTFQMMWQMFSGVSTSETRFFMTLIPFTSLTLGFLSRYPRFRSNWLLAGLLGLGFLNTILSLQILHIRHLFHVEQDPDHVKP
ncbi:MAG: hypothetical protein ACFFCZ_22895 [Promethearchaeota archaeon]